MATLVVRWVRKDFYFMANYELKAQVLKTNICKELKKIDKKHYLNCVNGVVYDQDLEDRYFNLLNEYDYSWIEEGRRINNSTFQKTKRVRERMKNMFNLGECVFLTLTFSDATLSTTTEKTRRRYVAQALASQEDFIANIDYGNDKEYKGRNKERRKGTAREHYHAVIVGRFDRHKWEQFGHCWTEKIIINEKTEKAVPKYLTKLTNHAVKNSTRCCRLIYKRKVKQS